MDYPFLIQPLGLLALLGIPIIILIYILKSKYVSKPVSSTFIWKRSLKYVKNRLPINFVFSLLLLLQILAVILASFAISRPQIVPFVTKDTVIIVDSSASMLTKNDEGKTRFELAIEEIEKEAAFAGDNNKFTLITAGAEANTPVFRTSQTVEIVSKAKELVCELGNADIDGALKLANNVQGINPEAKIYFYTDKEYVDTEGVEIKDFSKDSDINVAITNLTDSYMGGKYSFNATVELHAPANEDPTQITQMDAYVSLYLEGMLVSTQPVTLNAGKNVITFTHKSSLVAQDGIYYQMSSLSEYASARVVIEKLTEVGNKDAEIADGLLEDNARNIYATEGERVKILVVSKHVTMVKNQEGTQEEADTTKSTYLVTLLRNIGYSLSNKTDVKKEISQVNNGGAIEGYDLYIFDGVMPDVLPEDGAVWFIDPPKDPVGTSLQVSAQSVTAPNGGALYMVPAFDTGSETYKTITRNIAKRRDIAIGKFSPLSLDLDRINANPYSQYEEMFTCNKDSESYAIVMAGREANIRIVCMAFDIHDTNIHMLIDFPLLINNMLTYSLPKAVPNRSYDVGETVKFSAPVGATDLELKFFNQENGEFDTKDSFEAVDSELHLDLLGDYAITIKYASGYEQTIMLPTNVPASESKIHDVSEDMVASLEILPTTEDVVEDPMEIWPYFVMALLAILVIEWGVYYRDEF